MMRKLYIQVLVVVLVFTVIFAAHAKKKPVIRILGGTYIPDAGLVIDAGYDRRLDEFVTGYKVINVALINQSFNIIPLDPERDKWWIKFQDKKRPVPVIHDLRGQDPSAWSQIPERAKGLVAYPLVLPIGAREVVDIFVPNTFDLDTFSELDLYINSLGMKFEILVRQ